MKFKPELSREILPDSTLEADYAQAQEMGKVRLGAQCLYLRRLSRTAYVPCGRVVRAWLRQEEVRARMCCATANFDQFYVVMSCGGGQEVRWQVEDKAAGQRVLDHISTQNPTVEIGYRK